MEVGRSLRGARAAVFAAACVGVSAAGHMWMSAAPIAVWALVAAVLAVGGAAYALGGRQRGFASIAGLMLAGEAGLHLLFTASQRAGDGVSAGASAAPMASWMPDMSRIKMAQPVPAADWLCGHSMDGMQGMAMSGSGAGGSGDSATMASMPGMTGHGSAGMIAVHVAAGLLCAWWLRRGEAAAFALLRAFAGFALPLLVVILGVCPVPDLAVVVPRTAGAHAPGIRRLLGDALVRRGPPVPVFSM